MKIHPDRQLILLRLQERLDELAISFRGPVFRFLKPKFASSDELFAGKGPLHANGRWLLAGATKAVYTSLLPETALAEALASGRYYGLPDEDSSPLVFVSARARLKRVIDLRDGRVRQRLRISESTIRESDWRGENRLDREAVCQAWGWAMHEAGVEGFLCPSAAVESGENLVAFPGRFGHLSKVEVVRDVDWPRF